MPMTVEARKKLVDKLRNHMWKLDQEIPNKADRADFLWSSIRDGLLNGRDLLWQLADNIDARMIYEFPGRSNANPTAAKPAMMAVMI